MKNITWQWIGAQEAGVTRTFNQVGQYATTTMIFRYLSRLGDGIFWYALIIVLYLVEGRAAVMVILQMISAGLTATVLYKWLKQKTVRPRPYAEFPNILCLMTPLDRFSFPSGHTLHAVTFTGVAIIYYPALSWLLIPFTILVAISRLVLGLHYFSDVLVGALLGGAVAASSFLLF